MGEQHQRSETDQKLTETYAGHLFGGKLSNAVLIGDNGLSHVNGVNKGHGKREPYGRLLRALAHRWIANNFGWTMNWNARWAQWSECITLSPNGEGVLYPAEVILGMD